MTSTRPTRSRVSGAPRRRAGRVRPGCRPRHDHARHRRKPSRVGPPRHDPVGAAWLAYRHAREERLERERRERLPRCGVRNGVTGHGRIGRAGRDDARRAVEEIRLEVRLDRACAAAGVVVEPRRQPQVLDHPPREERRGAERERRSRRGARRRRGIRRGAATRSPRRRRRRRARPRAARRRRGRASRAFRARRLRRGGPSSSRPCRPCTCRRAGRAASAAGSAGRSSGRRCSTYQTSSSIRSAHGSDARPWICAQPVMPGCTSRRRRWRSSYCSTW